MAVQSELHKLPQDERRQIQALRQNVEEAGSLAQLCIYFVVFCFSCFERVSTWNFNPFPTVFFHCIYLSDFFFALSQTLSFHPHKFRPHPCSDFPSIFSCSPFFYFFHKILPAFGIQNPGQL